MTIQTAAKYVLQEIRDTDGQVIDTNAYPVDTASQIAAAKEALSETQESGLTGYPVWAGEGEDAVKTGGIIWVDSAEA